jgi:hypothetical protein
VLLQIPPQASGRVWRTRFACQFSSATRRTPACLLPDDIRHLLRARHFPIDFVGLSLTQIRFFPSTKFDKPQQSCFSPLQGRKACLLSFHAVRATGGRLVFGQACPSVCHWRIARLCDYFGACTPARTCASGYNNDCRPSTHRHRKLDHNWQRSASLVPGRRTRGRSRCRSHLKRNQIERTQGIVS